MKSKRTLERYPQDEDKFVGEYIAVAKGKIIAHGKDPRAVIAKAKKFTEEPLLAKVPTRGWKCIMS